MIERLCAPPPSNIINFYELFILLFTLDKVQCKVKISRLNAVCFSIGNASIEHTECQIQMYLVASNVLELDLKDSYFSRHSRQKARQLYMLPKISARAKTREGMEILNLTTSRSTTCH